MPPQLIRITFRRNAPSWIVEYGFEMKRELTEAEKQEYQQLNDELMDFQDFTTANILTPERQMFMEKKKRFEVLQNLAEKVEIEWQPVNTGEIEAILLVIQQNELPTYVENLPKELLNKLFSANLTIQSANIVVGSQSLPTGPSPVAPLERVGAILTEADKGWQELVTIKQEGDFIIVRPKRFLKEKWGPLNVTLKKYFGNEVWISEGKNDKNAHWRLSMR